MNDCFLLFYRSVLSPLLTCMLGFVAIISTFIALAFLFISPMHKRSTILQPLTSDAPQTFLPPLPSEAHSQKLPSIPTTLAEMHKMDPKDFEILSAAILVACEGHRFIKHCGGRGDRGVDVRLQNAIGLLVIVQCKRYAAHCHVRPAEIREFGGTIHLHDAVYGYFVTTSTFTPAAYRDRDSHGRIHTLNGQHLEMLLQRHPREIAQALDDIRKSMKDAFQV